MTKKDDASRFFDAVARRYDRIYAPGRDETVENLARVLAHLRPASRVLDLGVGTGRELPTLLDAGHSPVGLDASSEMLAICARRARPVPLVRGDLWDRLPWDDSSFDAIIALHGTLSHPPSSAAREALPAEVARILRPAGVLVVEVPTISWFDRIVREGGAVRVDENRGRFTDEASGATVEASFLSESDWTSLFETTLVVQVERAGDQLVIVGRRQTS